MPNSNAEESLSQEHEENEELQQPSYHPSAPSHEVNGFLILLYIWISFNFLGFEMGIITEFNWFFFAFERMKYHFVLVYVPFSTGGKKGLGVWR